MNNNDDDDDDDDDSNDDSNTWNTRLIRKNDGTFEYLRESSS